MFLKPGVQVFMWHLLRSTYIIDCTRRNLAQKSAIVLRDKFLLFVSENKFLKFDRFSLELVFQMIPIRLNSSCLCTVISILKKLTGNRYHTQMTLFCRHVPYMWH